MNRNNINSWTWTRGYYEGNREKEGLTADPGSPHHGIKKSSLHLKDVWGMLMGAEAQQFKFTEVMGRVRQADLTPFPDLPLVYQPTYSHE